MSGFATAFALEWRHVRHDRALWGLLAAFAVLMLIAAANGRSLVAAREAGAAQAREEARTVSDSLRRQAGQWNGQGKPPVAVQPGPVAFSVLPAWAALPPAPLAALARGQGDLLPDRYPVTARPLHTFLARAEPSSPAALALGSLDVAFLVIYGLPIVVLGVAFNAASREREAGTLALAAAQGVSPRAFIAAKWLARMLLTTGAVVAALAICAAVAWRAGAGTGAGDLLAWIAIAVGYSAFWFALCLVVNARGGSSDRNGVVLTGWWVVFVVLLPALAGLTVTSLLPPPSRVDLTTMLREASESADRAAASARDKYFFDHPELSGQEIDPDEFYRAVAASEQQVSRAVAPSLAAFDAQARRQQDLVEGLQYLSPAMIVQQGLLAASGTDSARYEDFRAQVASFHARWREYFVSRLERRARLAAADYDAAPAFDYRAPPAVERWRRLSAPLVALYGAAGLLGWVAWRRLRRQPVV